MTKLFLPNIRRMFIPDIGYTICDSDLSGADAQVVAWEADDRDLKTAFRRGLKIHVHNCRTIYPDFHKDWTDDDIKARPSPYYKKVKMGVHATNYGAVPSTLVERCGFELRAAEDFQRRWFAAHPGIRDWHTRYEDYLLGTRCWNCDRMAESLGRPCTHCGKHLGKTIKNRFGFRIIYQDRYDINLRNQALAWTPQSTVAFCTELGWVAMQSGPVMDLQIGFGQRKRIDWSHLLVEPRLHEKWGHIVQFLLQVHDSIVYQTPFTHEKDIPQIVDDLRVRVPYDDELIIPMGYKYSRDTWGNC